ncbi:MAG: UDP-N-acetylmuramoyl-tripeptide--D-alanyl-D-alanine ligase [Breznakia sp.]
MFSKTIHEIYTILGGRLTLNRCSSSQKIEGVSYDSRDVKERELYIAFVGDKVDGHIFLDDAYEKGARLALITNPEYANGKIACICVDDVTSCMQTLACIYRAELSAKIIGITGSNGKTACKDFLATMLSSAASTHKTKGNHNNELGVPYTLLHMDKSDAYGVIEMGMENMEDIHFLNTMVKQDAAIITNVGIAHFANLGSIENIARAKFEIIDSLADNALCVYYGDDEILQKIISEKNIKNLRVKTFGWENSNTIYPVFFKQYENYIIFQSNLSTYQFKVFTMGKHQVLNIMAAMLYAYDEGLSDACIQEGLFSYKSTKMRNTIEHVGEFTILNDAYKSNPQSAIAALETFQLLQSKYKIVILGDMLDLGNDEKLYHFELGEKLVAYDVQELITFGDLSKEILKGAKAAGYNRYHMHATTRQEISEYLYQHKEKDAAVLLKGSRGMALEKVIEGLRGKYDEKN